jgi:hypothetical protein
MITHAQCNLGAERILAAFSGVSDEARQVIGESLERHPAPLLKSIGSGLCHGPKLSVMVISRGLFSARWDGSAALVDRLGDSEPWRTIRECLIDALDAVPPTAVTRNGHNT